MIFYAWAFHIPQALLPAMKLESEFRLRLQLQQLEETLRQPTAQRSLTPNTWVKLRHLPSAFSFDEALLLCQQSEHTWLAWVPDYGEILLDLEQLDL
nr:hypothetical protein [Leptolyngbya sp. FACHB-36]